MRFLGRKRRKAAKRHDVIDLRDDRPVWGFPTRCPECGDFGYLDRIDMRFEVMLQHCPTCYAKWETPRSATAGSGQH